MWEKDLVNLYTIHFLSYDNDPESNTPLEYLKNDELKLKPNDLIACEDSTFVLDLTSKYGTGVLDLVDSKKGCLLKRFQHINKPQHGWVIHCRSVAPPKIIKALNILPFIQYGLCLDLELKQICKKSSENDHWPLHVEYVAHNTTDIFYTDFYDKNVIKVVRAQQR